MGTGGGLGSSAGNYGVYVTDASIIFAGGIGTVNVQGTGGTATGSDNNGVLLEKPNSVITSSGGNVSVIGIEGGGLTAFGIVTQLTGTITTAANGGNISLSANSMNMLAAISTNGSSSASIFPYTNGTAIDLGSASNTVGGPLVLSDTELDLISTGTLIIGNANAGNITISANITRSLSTNIQLISNGDVLFTGGGINTNGGTLLLDPANAPYAVKPTYTGTDVTAGILSFASDLAILISGTTLGDGSGATYSQLAVLGSVNLSGVNLFCSGSYVPVHNDSFTIVNNDGVDAVIGNFTGLSEGAFISNFLGSGLMATITYLGGDGNDVVIKISNPIFNVTDNIYYPSMNAALTSGTTGDGDILEIPSGTYLEPCITINKSVTIKPVGGPVILNCVIMNGMGKTMVLGGNFTINQLTLTNGNIRTNGNQLKCGTIAGGSSESYIITD